SGCGRCVAVTHCAVDHVEVTILSLIQSQLEIGVLVPREELGTPLNVENTVGSSATYRGEYAESAVDQIQVVPVREDGVVVATPRQATVGKGRIVGHKLGIAIGRQIDTREGLVIQGEREGQHDRGHLIIPVISYVGGARHNRTAELRYGNLAR